MAQDLSGLYISQSFQNLVQRSASGAFNVLATATGTEFVPVSASYAISASNAVNADNVISSSYAVSSSYALNASTADSATTAISASHAVNADTAISSSHSIISDSALTSISSSHAVNADVAISSSHAVNSVRAISSSHALNADNAISSSYALTASYASNAGGGAAFPYTGSAKITGSLEVVGPTTFKGAVIQTDIGFSTYFGLNSGTANLVAPILNKFSTGFGVGTLAAATGTENAAFGGDTLLFNTGGSKNAAYGQAGLKQNLTGGNNSSLGWQTLSNITAGDSNSALGAEAGRVIVGGAANTNSGQSVFFGANTKPLNVGDSNTIVIGYNAEGQGANTVVLGNTSIVSTQLRGNVNTTGSLKVRGPGDVGGANGANTLVAGAAIAAGSNNTVNSTDAAIVGGAGHTVTGDTSVILGGESNTINSAYCGIFGAASSGITNGNTAVILGGYQQQLQGTFTYLLGGNLNVISNSGAEYSGIIGGFNHSIATAVTASAIIGGKNITATKNETIYVPALEVVSGGVNITGSAVNNVNTITVASLTSSIDCNLSNTFQL